MGLKKKINEIATETANETVKALAPSLVAQITQTNTNFIGKILRFKEGNTYIVQDQNGNEKTVQYLGDKPISSGSGVMVTGGFIR